MTLDEIKKATRNDPVLTKVKNSLKEGKWDESDQSIKPFSPFLHNVALQQQSFFHQYQLWIIMYLYGLLCF